MQTGNTDEVNWHATLGVDIDIRFLTSGQVGSKARCEKTL